MYTSVLVLGVLDLAFGIGITTCMANVDPPWDIVRFGIIWSLLYGIRFSVVFTGVCLGLVTHNSGYKFLTWRRWLAAGTALSWLLVTAVRLATLRR